jgi:hypothetical protein
MCPVAAAAKKLQHVERVFVVFSTKDQDGSIGHGLARRVRAANDFR